MHSCFILYRISEIRVLSVLWLIEKGKKRLCQGNKVMKLAGVLGRNWGKECFVNKSVRQKTDCCQMFSYAILCLFRIAGECLGEWILKIVSHVKKKIVSHVRKNWK